LPGPELLTVMDGTSAMNDDDDDDADDDEA
jgi:hypothetical protein